MTETIMEAMTRLADGTTSTEADGRMIQKLLRYLDNPGAVVTSGIVYLEGKGTIENPPTSIHTIAKQVLTVVSK